MYNTYIWFLHLQMLTQLRIVLDPSRTTKVLLVSINNLSGHKSSKDSRKIRFLTFLQFNFLIILCRTKKRVSSLFFIASSLLFFLFTNLQPRIPKTPIFFQILWHNFNQWYNPKLWKKKISNYICFVVDTKNYYYEVLCKNKLFMKIFFPDQRRARHVAYFESA